MDMFKKAKTVRLMTFRDKYLTAEEDGESVSQSRENLSKNVIWTVEIEENRNVVRLKSCFGKYLSASNIHIVPGHSGKKVLQTSPSKRTDVSVEWEPIRDGFQVRLKTLMGDYLRPHGGLPPWRNTVTHDVPHRSKTKMKMLWDIEIVEPCEGAQHQKIRRSKSDLASSNIGSCILEDLLD